MYSLVSVIVPVYKVEDCIVRCLDSLRGQSLSNIEIILVDDASPDRCGEICDAYAEKDMRFKVIHCKINQGLSASRNLGIQYASSNYLMFVDSDDWVHEDFCKLPYECAIQYKADLVMFKAQRIIHDNCVNHEPSKINANVLCNSGYKTTYEALQLLLNIVGNVVWNKLYHKKLFKDISFPKGYFCEDLGTTYKTVLQASGVYYLDKVLYYYCFHEGSISTLRTTKIMQDHFKMAMQQYHDLVEWGGFSDEELDLILIKFCMEYCIRKKRDISCPEYMFCANMLCSCNKIPDFLSPKRKLLFVLFRRCPFLFEIICKLWNKKYC